MRTHVSLFCGLGGTALGMACKNDAVIGVDIDPAALATFEHNMGRFYKHVEVIRASLDPADPGKTGVPRLDPATLPRHVYVLDGSPPCKTFSGMASFKGGRVCDMTFVNAFKAMKEYLKPRWWVMENVIGLKLPGARIFHANEFGLLHERARKFWGNFSRVEIGPIKRVMHPTILAGERQVGTKRYERIDSCGRFFQRHLHPGDLQILMGFPAPPEFEVLGKDDAEKIRQIGNAVCPPVSRAIWKAIESGRPATPVAASLDDFTSIRVPTCTAR